MADKTNAERAGCALLLTADEARALEYALLVCLAALRCRLIDDPNARADRATLERIAAFLGVHA